MFIRALTAHQANGGSVPQFMIDNMAHWVDHVAEPAKYADPTERD